MGSPIENQIMSNYPVPKESPLSQTIESEGRSVQVDIYEDGEGGWLLEVVDEFFNSTVWEESFGNEQDALDEALKTIREEGIESLIGSEVSPSNRH